MTLRTRTIKIMANTKLRFLFDLGEKTDFASLRNFQFPTLIKNSFPYFFINFNFHSMSERASELSLNSIEAR